MPQFEDDAFCACKSTLIKECNNLEFNSFNTKLYF